MNIEAQLLLARGIAFGAHAGQVDKAGVPYICHPIAVAELLVDLEDKVVAYLHDVIEDTPLEDVDLLSAGIFPHLVADVVLLRHLEHERRAIYLDRIALSPRAVRVKLADIAHNSDPQRLASLDERTRLRLEKKYAQDSEFLRSLVQRVG